MEDLIAKILADLSDELKIVDEADMKTLSSKIKKAVMDVRLARAYPMHFSEELIVKDLAGYYSKIWELAMYDYNQIGAEGETSHSENGISRSWKERQACLNGVFAFCSSL